MMTDETAIDTACPLINHRINAIINVINGAEIDVARRILLS